jgi:RNA polymerase subunit RPABC4/transcription elongation factor Spt4
MQYCRKCGKELEDDARFCQQCGTGVRGTQWEDINVAADDLLSKVKELIKEGNITRIIVLNENEEQLFEIPVTLAAVGTLLAPQLAALGVIAALVTRPIIRIERRVKQTEEQ